MMNSLTPVTEKIVHIILKMRTKEEDLSDAFSSKKQLRYSRMNDNLLGTTWKNLHIIKMV